MFGMSRKFGGALRVAVVAVSALALGGIMAGPSSADEKLVILGSVPGLKFPFFVHMMKADQGRGRKARRRGHRWRRPGQLDQADRRRRGGDLPGVNGIVISPNEVDAMAPALQEAVEPRSRSSPSTARSTKVPGLLGHVGADKSKGGEAQAELIMKLFPNGAKIMNLQGQPGAGPAIDRNKGLHNVLDQHKDKYKIVFEQTAEFDRVKGLSVTEAALAGMQTPPDVIVAANDDMSARRHGGGEGAQPRRQDRDDRLRRPARGSGPGEATAA